MPEPAQPASPKSAGSFAAFLASFTGAVEKRSDDWDLSELADDVATISYEQALLAHRGTQVSESAAKRLQESPVASIENAATDSTTPGRKNRKTTSITIRLTEAEQAQLHQRAVDANLSVSAYIRSCIFEAESLRAQVKEALSQIRGTTEEPEAPRTGGLATAAHKRFHFFPRWQRREKIEN